MDTIYHKCRSKTGHNTNISPKAEFEVLAIAMRAKFKEHHFVTYTIAKSYYTNAHSNTRTNKMIFQWHVICYIASWHRHIYSLPFIRSLSYSYSFSYMQDLRVWNHKLFTAVSKLKKRNGIASKITRFLLRENERKCSLNCSNLCMYLTVSRSYNELS